VNIAAALRDDLQLAYSKTFLHAASAA